MLWGEPAVNHIGISEQKASKGFEHLPADPKHSWEGSCSLSTSTPRWQRTPIFTSQLCLLQVSLLDIHFPSHACITLPLLFHTEADNQLFIWLETVRVSPHPHCLGAWLGQCMLVPAQVNNDVLRANGKSFAKTTQKSPAPYPSGMRLLPRLQQGEWLGTVTSSWGNGDLWGLGHQCCPDPSLVLSVSV